MAAAGPLNRQQTAFLNDVGILIEYIDSLPHYTATFGHTYRDYQTQRRLYNDGLSLTLDSMHNKRLAVDLNIFYKGEYTGTMPTRRTVRLLRPIGEYWKGLGRHNVWGGDWKGFPDPMHFERSLE